MRLPRCWAAIAWSKSNNSRAVANRCLVCTRNPQTKRTRRFCGTSLPPRPGCPAAMLGADECVLRVIATRGLPNKGQLTRRAAHIHGRPARPLSFSEKPRRAARSRRSRGRCRARQNQQGARNQGLRSWRRRRGSTSANLLGVFAHLRPEFPHVLPLVGLAEANGQAARSRASGRITVGQRSSVGVAIE